MKKIKRILHFIIWHSECAVCDRFESCDHRVWIHRVEVGCKYGEIHGE